MSDDLTPARFLYLDLLHNDSPHKQTLCGYCSTMNGRVYDGETNEHIGWRCPRMVWNYVEQRYRHPGEAEWAFLDVEDQLSQ